ncbi:MAG TPA: SET domain-containing protein [Tepidisphaeraceae bacterium]
MCRQSDIVEVRRLDNRGRGGRGVFAVRDIPAGAVIERAPVLLIPREQVFGDSPEARRGARISWYVFDWKGITKRNYVALVLGYGSIYNHSLTPNARCEPEPPDVMGFHATRDIAAGEEITINYNDGFPDSRSLGFDPH